MFQATNIFIVWILFIGINIHEHEVRTITHNSRLRRGSVTAPDSDVSIYDAIHDRRMDNDFSDFVQGRDALQRMVDAAVWAPNQRLTNPWRFFVLNKRGEKRAQVAQLAYDNQCARGGP